MAEEIKTTESGEVVSPVLVIPFGLRAKPSRCVAKKGSSMMKRLAGVDYDDEHKTAVAKYEDVNFQEEVQACRELCGMTFIKSQLASGKIVPESLYDDGKSGMDLSILPADRHIAAKQADKLNDSISQIAKELGLDPTDVVTAEKLEKLLSSEVEKRYNAEIEAKKGAEGGDK